MQTPQAAKQGKTLTDLIADLKMPQEALEVRLRFVDGCDFKTLGKGILKDYEKYASALSFATVAPDNHEGCRVNYDDKHGDGWALLRMSLHEPILPINIESDSPFGAFKIAKDLYWFLKKYSCLDTAPLKAAIEKERARLLEGVKAKYQANYLSSLFY